MELDDFSIRLESTAALCHIAGGHLLHIECGEEDEGKPCVMQKQHSMPPELIKILQEGFLQWIFGSHLRLYA